MVPGSPCPSMVQFAQIRSSFAHAPRTLALVWRSSPGATLAIALLTLASAGLPLAIAYAGKAIVDQVVAHATGQTLRWVLIELGLVVVQAMVLRILGFVRQTLGARLALD